MNERVKVNTLPSISPDNCGDHVIQLLRKVRAAPGKRITRQNLGPAGHFTPTTYRLCSIIQ